MTEQLPIGVLVGVDGSAGSDNAVRYGAMTARRLGSGLTLVHVVPDYVPLAPMPPLLPDDLVEVGRALTASARDVAEAYVDAGTVATLVPTGATTPVLVALSGRAGLVVLGHNIRTRARRLFTGAVTTGVISRAACPVVSVPDCWDPDRTAGEVVVGINDSAHGDGLLERGFATAEALASRLTIIHAWELPSVYDDVIVRRTHDPDWNVRALADVAGRLNGLRKKHLAVLVDVRVLHASPVQALAEAAAKADLVMLERRGGRLPAGLRLGSTARAVLREACCPVEVFPPREALVGADRTAASAGATLT